MFDIQNQKGDKEEILYNRLVDLQNATGKNKLTEEKLKSRYNLTDEELAEIKVRAVRRGNTNLVIGIILTVIGGLTFLATVFMERPKLLLLSPVIFGIILTVRGSRMRKIE
ncbi:hypothetical protein D3C86_1705000 [compost metagenome]